MSKLSSLVVLTTLLASTTSGQTTSPTDSCARLAQLGLPGAKVVSASVVAAGTFSPPTNLPPWMAGDPAFYKSLGAFCRVIVEATPTADSAIQIEV